MRPIKAEENSDVTEDVFTSLIYRFNTERLTQKIRHLNKMKIKAAVWQHVPILVDSLH